MIYFKDIKTEEELKAKFKELARRYHPDLGGCTETMKAVNAEYDELLERILSGKNLFGTGLKDQMEIEKELREKIEELSNLLGIEIEICGSWLWVTGATKACKDILKEAGFKWARKKKAWYFHTGVYRKRGGKTYSLNEIRNTHGSVSVSGIRRKAIA